MLTSLVGYMQKGTVLSDRRARLQAKLAEVSRAEQDLRQQLTVEQEQKTRDVNSVAVAKDRLAKDKEYLHNIGKELKSFEDKLRANGKAYEKIIGQMGATNEKLRTLMDTRALSSMEEKKQRNLDLLQRQFRGVHVRFHLYFVWRSATSSPLAHLRARTLVFWCSGTSRGSGKAESLQV